MMVVNGCDMYLLRFYPAPLRYILNQYLYSEIWQHQNMGIYQQDLQTTHNSYIQQHEYRVG